MTDRIERLRALLNEVNVWQAPDRPFESDGKLQSGTENMIHFHSNAVGGDEDLARITPAWRAIKNNRMDSTSMASSARMLELGEQIGHEEVFCSLKALVRYPYEYVEPPFRDRVVEEYFAKDKLFERKPWDFFYIYPPREINRQAIILVPLCQVEHFLCLINTQLGTRSAMPKTACYQMSFPPINKLSPRYLGRSTDVKTTKLLKLSIPSASYRPDTEPYDVQEPPPLALEEFKAKMELLFEADRQKHSIAKEKKRKARTNLQQSRYRSIERVQTYLGIRQNSYDSRGPSVSELQPPNVHTHSIIAADSAVDHVKEPASNPGREPQLIDSSKPVLYIQEHSAVFICVDIEAYERNHNLITEIGVATLDTKDIMTVAPGENGQNWRSAIRPRHFRIKEYSHLQNTEWVQGCPDRFLFGSSEWISIKDAAYEVSNCFKPPYSGDVGGNRHKTALGDLDTDKGLTIPDQGINPGATTISSPSSDKTSPSKRNIIIVGHDLGTDINYLKQLGYDVRNLSNLCDRVDTATMHQGLRQESQPRSLGGVLGDLDIAGWYLHNAGNDAVYTLQATLGIALRSWSDRCGDDDGRHGGGRLLDS